MISKLKSMFFTECREEIDRIYLLAYNAIDLLFVKPNKLWGLRIVTLKRQKQFLKLP